MAGNRLQRWAVILSAYDYVVKCIRSKHNCVADSLSRLPVNDESKEYRSESYINFISEQAPIDYKIIAKHTSTDIVLQRLTHAIKTNWLYCKDKELKPYFDIKQYLNIESGCILFGHRVIIPQSLRNAVLQMLHSCHQGIVKCKSIARGYVYWPGIDGDIERECLGCAVCAATRPSPPQAPIHPWAWPQVPWFRVHVDFFMLGKLTYFVLVDAHSKWIEAHYVSSTSADVTITKLRQIFSHFGLVRECVSDNGPPFNSTFFKTFMESCGIKHILVSPYKPSSNGAAESAVKIIKGCLKKALLEKADLNAALDKFLLSYRSTAHSLTGKSPAELLLGRKLRTHYDILRPDINDIVYTRQKKMIDSRQNRARGFDEGDKILFKCFRDNKFKWTHGIIIKRLGPVSYLVQNNDKTFKKHVDHITKLHQYDRTTHGEKGERGSENNKSNNSGECDFNIMSYCKNKTNDIGNTDHNQISSRHDDGASAASASRTSPSRHESTTSSPKRTRRQVERFRVVQ